MVPISHWSSWLAIATYAVLIDSAVALSTDVWPRLTPSALPGFQGLLKLNTCPSPRHAAFHSSPSYDCVAPDTYCRSEWPVLSHSAKITGLKVEPGKNPLDPPI